ncbi:MAG: WXG100 family type VII secretion target [Myxococcales bacterium]|nr:WXG100 family type VII secretion target [Myxococcales bacterium]
MSDEIRLVYPVAEDMIRVFNGNVEELQDINQGLQEIANQLEDGALLGEGGALFVELLRGSFSPSLTRYITKIEEMATDVQGAISDMQQSDQTSRSQFGR